MNGVLKANHFFFIRWLMNPEDDRIVLVCKVACNDLVGYKHKFFYENMGIIPSKLKNVLNISTDIQYDFRLWEIKIKASLALPTFSQFLTKSLH